MVQSDYSIIDLSPDERCEANNPHACNARESALYAATEAFPYLSGIHHTRVSERRYVHTKEPPQPGLLN